MLKCCTDLNKLIMRKTNSMHLQLIDSNKSCILFDITNNYFYWCLMLQCDIEGNHGPYLGIRHYWWLDKSNNVIFLLGIQPPGLVQQRKTICIQKYSYRKSIIRGENCCSMAQNNNVSASHPKNLERNRV